MKAIIGPGTGLGQAMLVKHGENDLYEPFAAEGGHCEFAAKSDDDWELVKFARNFIETSNNIENLRAKGKIGRVSAERLTAGPAVPLLYAYMKQKHPQLESVLEKRKSFDEIESKDIIGLAMREQDPLCLKVVEKFT